MMQSANLIRWYPVKEGQRVLIVAEPDRTPEVEKCLRKMGAEVTVCSPNGEAFVEKEGDAAHKTGNVSIGLTDSGEAAGTRYDVILQIGVLDVGQRNAEAVWRERLAAYRALLAESGVLLLAVSNRLAVKYFAGSMDDCYEAYFAGPRGYAAAQGSRETAAQAGAEAAAQSSGKANARDASGAEQMTRQALSLAAYQAALRGAGFAAVQTYFPYPDEQAPSVIFSEERLPQPGELANVPRIYERDRYLLFDEEAMCEALLREGVFPVFANGYLIVARPEAVQEAHAIYIKYSAERDKKYRIATEIVQKPDGTRVVRKYPLTPEAVSHIRRLEMYRAALQEQADARRDSADDIRKSPDAWSDSANDAQKSPDARRDSADDIPKLPKIEFCRVWIKDDTEDSPEADHTICRAEFAWAEGESLQNRIKGLLEQDAETEAEALIRQYCAVAERLSAGKYRDVDLIASNLLVRGETWCVIDYEWTFAAEIPAKWIVYRGLHYLSVELSGYPLTRQARLMELAGITAEEEATFAAWEAQFQAYLRGDTVPAAAQSEAHGGNVYRFPGDQTADDLEAVRRINRHGTDARKIVYHLDSVKRQGRRLVIGGWAAARVARKTYIPVQIAIFDEEGNSVGGQIGRTMRPDVAEVLGAEGDFPYYGFAAQWVAPERAAYTLRLSIGRLWKDITIG